uniref:Ixodegrin YY-39 n=1 Tax=Ixodes scapularis TaxID=6945 RepID=IXO39_IXOSC|nr:RecName: Full=Ixodegrin YY-39; AltName: Full=Platelet aggregation inhibitor; Short=PAI; AltName: Full=Tick anti-thrombosis peptide; Flags: Precursor [Ixodes scapularis]AAY66649.1 putative RGD containing protein [Ixodes scapularis]
MNAALIAALLILGALTLDATAYSSTCERIPCTNNSDCHGPDLCQCRPPRGDDFGYFCSEY